VNRERVWAKRHPSRSTQELSPEKAVDDAIAPIKQILNE
jgi:hypothetical protein